jgi:hypothetical protein
MTGENNINGETIIRTKTRDPEGKILLMDPRSHATYQENLLATADTATLVTSQNKSRLAKLRETLSNIFQRNQSTTTS